MKKVQLENVEFEGDNNVYILSGDGETALIDTGVSTPGTRDELEHGLNQHGLGFMDIDMVFLTHWHADHAGLAGYIQRLSGADVYIHEEDEALVRQDEGEWSRMQDLQSKYFREWGMPGDQRDELTAFLDGASEVMGEPVDVEGFQDGDRFQVGDVLLEALHTPGHTSGLTCFITEDGGVYSGDALLPVYTPNVGGADVRTEKPLEKYIASLNKIVTHDFSLAWPGHRGTIREPEARALDIIAHHRERSRKIIQVLEEYGELSAWSVGSHLFGELESIHIMHGPGESYAHLEHMESIGVVEEVGDSPKRYRLVENRPELDEWFNVLN